jgi:hypothetical protein
MRNFVRVRQLAVVSGFALITTGMASVAVAEAHLNAYLRGAYAFTTARTCTISPVPFLEPNFAVPTGTSLSRQSAVDNGIITYHGDGTATSIGRSSGMNITSTGGSFNSVSGFRADVNYAVHPGGTVETTVSSTFEIVAGANVGLTGTTTGQVGWLQISHGNTMLVSAPAQGISVETQLITPLLGNQFTQYRLCVRSTTQTKLPSH